MNHPFHLHLPALEKRRQLLTRRFCHSIRRSVFSKDVPPKRWVRPARDTSALELRRGNRKDRADSVSLKVGLVGFKNGQDGDHLTCFW
ncbi:hypothetical protein CDAR_514231 [Caerostris darwini]|uniref:Ribosomal protein S14 n=1 Tax=Caerostris darwini TaxID=1538125 RepID=A0AAV4UPH2_9ARAC|nr:hypothetical protein CDAR_514231 [Caerostris darwini]